MQATLLINYFLMIKTKNYFETTFDFPTSPLQTTHLQALLHLSTTNSPREESKWFEFRRYNVLYRNLT